MENPLIMVNSEDPIAERFAVELSLPVAAVIRTPNLTLME